MIIELTKIQRFNTFMLTLPPFYETAKTRTVVKYNLYGNIYQRKTKTFLIPLPPVDHKFQEVSDFC